EILRLVNDERQRSDAPPLKLSRRLMLASRGHSYDMALRNYLGHYGPAGDTPGERASSVGVNSGAIGENLYQDRDRDGAHLAERAIRRWLGDKERRTNMLSRDFATTGIGIARAADGTAYVTGGVGGGAARSAVKRGAHGAHGEGREGSASRRPPACARAI